MHGIELYAAVRQYVLVEGHSLSAARRTFGIGITTAKKMCTHAFPPGLQRTRPGYKRKLGPYVEIIDAILRNDMQAPPKQRHTAIRIFRRLKAEHGFDGSYDAICEYVAQMRPRMREVFVPLVHPPGHAQVDFGQAVAVVAGVRQTIHIFCMSLPYSDAFFLKVYPAETTAAFLDGHVSGFRFFGKVPHSILYDNTSLAVAGIRADGARLRTVAFSALVSHYLFKDCYARVARGNDKAKVEILVRIARRSFLTPIPSVESMAELNRKLEANCVERRQAQLPRRTGTVGMRLRQDLVACRPLPERPFDACETSKVRVSSASLVCFCKNYYSVPTRFAYRHVLVKGFADEVAILCGRVTIARHARAHGSEAMVFDPLHYLELLEQKPAALDQAAPMQNWTLPPPFVRLRHLFERRLGEGGKREYIRVLRLLETFELPLVTLAVRDALRLGVLGSDAIKRLVVAHIDGRPKRLDIGRDRWKSGSDGRMRRRNRYRSGGVGADGDHGPTG